MKTSHKYVHYFLYFWSNVYKPQNIEQKKGTNANQEAARANLIAIKRFNKQQNNNILPSQFNLYHEVIINIDVLVQIWI